MELKLDIYDGKKVVKTYTAQGYDLMVGTVEDVLGVFDFDKLNDETEVAKLVLRSCLQIKPLVRDIFPDMTDEDYRRVRVADLIPLFIGVASSILETFKGIKRKN